MVTVRAGGDKGGLSGLRESQILRAIAPWRPSYQHSAQFPVDRDKCARWNVTPVDVQAGVGSAVGGRPVGQVQEGGRCST